MPKSPDDEVVDQANDEIAKALRQDKEQTAMRKADDDKRRQKRIKAEAGIVDPPVKVRVTKFGEGKVSTGTFTDASGDIYAKRDQILEVDPDTAAAMEASGFGEIQD